MTGSDTSRAPNIFRVKEYNKVRFKNTEMIGSETSRAQNSSGSKLQLGQSADQRVDLQQQKQLSSDQLEVKEYNVVMFEIPRMTGGATKLAFNICRVTQNLAM